MYTKRSLENGSSVLGQVQLLASFEFNFMEVPLQYWNYLELVFSSTDYLRFGTLENWILGSSISLHANFGGPLVGQWHHACQVFKIASNKIGGIRSSFQKLGTSKHFQRNRRHLCIINWYKILCIVEDKVSLRTFVYWVLFFSFLNIWC